MLNEIDELGTKHQWANKHEASSTISENDKDCLKAITMKQETARSALVIRCLMEAETQENWLIRSAENEKRNCKMKDESDRVHLTKNWFK